MARRGHCPRRDDEVGRGQGHVSVVSPDAVLCRGGRRAAGGRAERHLLRAGVRDAVDSREHRHAAGGAHRAGIALRARDARIALLALLAHRTLRARGELAGREIGRAQRAIAHRGGVDRPARELRARHRASVELGAGDRVALELRAAHAVGREGGGGIADTAPSAMNSASVDATLLYRRWRVRRMAESFPVAAGLPGSRSCSGTKLRLMPRGSYVVRRRANTSTDGDVERIKGPAQDGGRP